MEATWWPTATKEQFVSMIFSANSEYSRLRCQASVFEHELCQYPDVSGWKDIACSNCLRPRATCWKRWLQNEATSSIFLCVDSLHLEWFRHFRSSFWRSSLPIWLWRHWAKKPSRSIQRKKPHQSDDQILNVTGAYSSSKHYLQRNCD